MDAFFVNAPQDAGKLSLSVLDGDLVADFHQFVFRLRLCLEFRLIEGREALQFFLKQGEAWGGKRILFFLLLLFLLGTGGEGRERADEKDRDESQKAVAGEAPHGTAFQ